MKISASSAFALLIVHGIIDSADGQLARMTNRVTELGRVLDGVAGYVTHAAIYLAVAAGMIHRGGDPFVTILLMLIAAVSNAMHAQLYEYFRPAYVMVVEKGRLRQDDPGNVPIWVRPFYGFYLAAQNRLIGLHPSVMAALLSRSDAGQLRDDDRARYRQCFRGTVRGWHLLGDNTRFYPIGVLACLHRIDLFFLHSRTDECSAYRPLALATKHRPPVSRERCDSLAKSSPMVRTILFDMGGTLDGDGQHWLDRFLVLYGASVSTYRANRFDRRSMKRNANPHQTMRLPRLISPT